MASALSIVDPNDTTVTLFELNAANTEAAGAVTCSILHDPDWGDAPLQSSVAASQQVSVGSTVFTRRGLATASLRVRIKGTSYDKLNKGLGRLATLLAEGCTMRWQADGSSLPLFVDVEPSATPVLLDGRELALHKAAVLCDTPEGIELRLVRQPYFRGPALDPSLNLLSNGTMLRDGNDDGTPNGWTLSNGTLTIDTTTDSLQVVHNSNQDIIYQDYTGTGAFTASAEAWQTGGNRVLGLRLISRPSNTTLATTSVTATAAGERISVTGTTSGGDTGIRVMLVVTSGSTSSTWKVRNVQLEAGSTASPFRVKSETIAMDPASTGFARYLPVYNPGNAPAPCVLTMAFPDASTAVTGVRYTLRSTGGVDGYGDIGQYLNGPYVAQAEATGGGWTVAFGTDTSNPAGTDSSASGSDFASITHTTDPTTLKKRITWTRTTKLDALRGDFHVFARMKASGARTYEFELRYGGGTTDAAQATTGRKRHDVSDATSFAWVLVPLGTISFPRSGAVPLGGVRLELWSRITSGTAANINVDYLELRAADATAAVNMDLATITDTYLGAALVTPVTSPPNGTAGYVKQNDIPTGTINTMALNESTDNCGVPPNTGHITTVGRYRVTWAVSINHIMTTGATRSAYCNVRNITDAATLQQVLTWTHRADQFYPVQYASLEFTAVSGRSYQAQVERDPGVSGIEETYVHWIKIEQTPVMQQNQQMRTDPGSTPERSDAARLDSSGNYLGDATADAVPFWIPPGLSLIGFSIDDVTPAHYDLPESVLSRTAVVAATVHPRYWS